ncbi:MAG: Maf family protein [Succinatimonas sp.]|nr:Maf family protein [Succinatimonas sp.]
MNELILASGSPRRKDFIESLGLKFKIVVPDIDESRFKNESPCELVQRLSKLKAQAVASKHQNDIVIAADTIVVLDNEILGKPSNRNDAKIMLKKLSGRTHEVFTGYTVQKGEICYHGLEHTQVDFAILSDELISSYVNSGECDDKAGSYAIQGLAAMFIKKVNGDVNSVIGLPICTIRILLEKFGITPKFVKVLKNE